MDDESLSDRSLQRHRALSRWENEGGAGGPPPHEPSVTADGLSDVPLLTNTELVQLRVRVEQLELVRELAAYISPRPGFTHHPMTLREADEMRSLLERSGQFRSESG